MTYDQFENTLQDWLDEGRLDEAECLLEAVCPADRLRCAELLRTYRVLFASLPAALHSVPDVTPHGTVTPSDTGPGPALPRPTTTPLAPWGMALALGLAVLVMLPGRHEAPRTAPADATAQERAFPLPHKTDTVEMASSGGVRHRGRHFTQLSTVSLEPLARNVVLRTDDAFKSLGQFVVTLNPIDDHLTTYREAAPLIGTLTRGFMPGPHSLGDAFSVLQESISPATPISASPPSEVPTESPASAGIVG